MSHEISAISPWPVEDRILVSSFSQNFPYPWSFLSNFIYWLQSCFLAINIWIFWVLLRIEPVVYWYLPIEIALNQICSYLLTIMQLWFSLTLTDGKCLFCILRNSSSNKLIVKNIPENRHLIWLTLHKIHRTHQSLPISTDWLVVEWLCNV